MRALSCMVRGVKGGGHRQVEPLRDAVYVKEINRTRFIFLVHE